MEIITRVVRDLDDEGRLLWIPETKTEAGKRTLPVPEFLQPYLSAIAKGKEPEDLLFGRHWRDSLEVSVRYAGGETADPYREDTTRGIFFGKTMLILLRAVVNPCYRPQLAAPIDCAPTPFPDVSSFFAMTSLLHRSKPIRLLCWQRAKNDSRAT